MLRRKRRWRKRILLFELSDNMRKTASAQQRILQKFQQKHINEWWRSAKQKKQIRIDFHKDIDNFLRFENRLKLIPLFPNYQTKFFISAIQNILWLLYVCQVTIILSYHYSFHQIMLFLYRIIVYYLNWCNNQLCISETDSN